MIVLPDPAAPDAEIWGRRTVVDEIVIVSGAGGAARHAIVRDDDQSDSSTPTRAATCTVYVVPFAMPGKSMAAELDVSHVAVADQVPPEVRCCQAPAPTRRRTDRAVWPGIGCHDTGTGVDPSAVDGATSTGCGTRDPPKKSVKVPHARLGADPADAAATGPDWPTQSPAATPRDVETRSACDAGKAADRPAPAAMTTRTMSPDPRASSSPGNDGVDE